MRAAQHAAADARVRGPEYGLPCEIFNARWHGSALLTDPERVRDILTSLRRNLPPTLPVTAKIRLLENFDDTLQLAG